MAHQIQKHDRVVATERTWHGLEIIEEEITRENAGNAFEVVVKPPLCRVPDEHSPSGDKLIEVDGFKVLVNADTGRPITVAKQGYEIIQNEWMWRFADKVREHVDAQITCAGTLANQQRAFISLRLNQEWTPVDERWLQNINICNSFDTSTAFEFYDSGTRVVCDNTLQLSRMNAVRSSNLLGRVLHMGSVEKALEGMLQLTEQAMKHRQEFEKVLEQIAQKSIGQDVMVKLLASQLAVRQPDKTEKLTLHALKGIEGIAGLFYRGIGCSGSTYYDLFNAGTQWWTHGEGSGKGEDTKRFANSEFGTAAKRKVDFVNTIVAASMNDDLLNKLADRGDELLREAEQTVDTVLATC